MYSALNDHAGQEVGKVAQQINQTGAIYKVVRAA